MQLHSFLKLLARDERGGTAIEYGLIASVVVIASLGALEAVADENTGLWGVISSKVSASMGN